MFKDKKKFKKLKNHTHKKERITHRRANPKMTENRPKASKS